MKYYAHFYFNKLENSKNYILKSSEGSVKNLVLPKFSDTKKNVDAGVVGKEYIVFTLPRSAIMKKYFAYTFEMAGGKPITSTEGLNGLFRTFGDGRNLGSKDLILFQFSEDLKKLDMYFVEGKGGNICDKKTFFQVWNEENKLEMGV